MKTNISEELPARKHAPAVPAKGSKGAPDKGGKEGGGSVAENSEKRIRQAVYDIRYRARREDIDLKQAYAQYMSNSSLNPAERKAVKDKLFGKKGGVSEQYSVESVDWAVDSVAGALYKVFVEGVKKEEKIELQYSEDAEEKERKYKVRVTDPKNDKSYVRYATREKITALRAKGLKVEMTEHGDPYEGTKREGKREVSNNRSGLDRPVHPSKRDGDVNDDGKKDKTDSYIYNRRDKIRKALRKEDYLWFEGTTVTDGKNRVPLMIDVAEVDNSKRIRVLPQDGSNPQNNGGIIQAGNEMEGPFLTEKAKSKAQQRFMALVYKKKKEGGEASPEVEDAAKGMSKKEAKKYASTEHEGLPEKKKGKKKKSKMNEEANCPKCGKSPCECDTRANKTYRDLLKAKFRSMGRSPLAVCGDEENLEKSYNDMMTASFIKSNKETGKLEPVHVFKEASPTGYNKGNKDEINKQGGAGYIGDDAVKDANRGVSNKIRAGIPLKPA
jgi:hypothetical protein